MGEQRKDVSGVTTSVSRRAGNNGINFHFPESITGKHCGEALQEKINYEEKTCKDNL
jgi:hypothetical protein